ncbi:hypothetical protein NECID01_1205 [Nematocida sp. AWRm77]|nr:hypothetical protein NECID01_1205 [Nematocida sp. AWRm77]
MRFSIREKQVGIRSVFACCVFALAVFLTREARAELLSEAEVKERIEKEVEDVKKSMGSVESCSFEKIHSELDMKMAEMREMAEHSSAIPIGMCTTENDLWNNYLGNKILIRAYFPFLFEKSLAEFRLTKEDIASVQRMLAEAEKKMDEGCSVRLKRIRRIMDLKKDTQATIDSMMNKWKETFIEAAIFENKHGNLQAESFRDTLTNQNKEALNNFEKFREKWKEIIKAHNMVANDLLDGLGKAIYELHKNYTENNTNKEELVSMIRNLTRFFFITDYLNHLDEHYFKDGIESVLADPSKLSTNVNVLGIPHMIEFQKKLETLHLYRGIWISNNSRNEANNTKIVKTVFSLYNDFIKTNNKYLWITHEYIVYGNQKYPEDADKIVDLLYWAYKHHPKQVFSNLETQTGAIKEYEKGFDRVMTPLKERHENILTLLMKIARCPQSITNKTRIAIDELLTKPIVTDSTDGRKAMGHMRWFRAINRKELPSMQAFRTFGYIWR